MPARILVIGLDSYDKDLLLSWAAAGYLKTFAGLLERATWALTESPPAVYGGAVWPSFNTALSPAHHRRFFRRQAPVGEYLDADFKPTDIQGMPFWETLSDAGRRVAVIDVPHSRLSPGLNGIQVVDWATHEPEHDHGSTCPAELRDEIDTRFPGVPQDRCEQTTHTAEGYRALVDHLRLRLRSKTALSRHYLSSSAWDLFITVFGEAHCAGHQLWQLHDPTHPAHDATLAAETGDLLRDIYVDLDEAVAEVIAAADTETHVMVLCSHGMGPLYGGSVVLDEILRRFEAPADTAPRSLFGRMKTNWYKLPPVLRGSWPARLLKSRLQGSLHRSLLVPDRHKRRFFAIPHNPHAGAIRINVAGRETHGMVQPGAEYRQVCEDLRHEMLALRCADTGQPAVDEVHVTREIYDGPFIDELPDLLVQWNRSRPASVLSSPRVGDIAVPPIQGRTGDHTSAGLFLATGPGIPARRLDRSIPIVDFAPTFAALLGVTPPDDFEGQPIVELLSRKQTDA